MSFGPFPGGGSVASATDDGSSTGDLGSSLLVPSAPADQFTDPTPIAPASTGASVMPASGATAPQLATSSATWGQPIPELFGTCQVLGFPLWTGDAQYTTDISGATALVVDFAVVFGRAGPNGTGASIRNIYFDGVAFISADDDTGQLSRASDFSYTFYDGTQSEGDVDPTIDAKEAPYTPAFLGMIYMVVQGYIGTGSKFPQVVAELHINEVSAGTGAHIAPFILANTIDTQSYNNNALAWDDVRAILYTMYRPGGTGNYVLDTYDTAAQQFLSRAVLATSGSIGANALLLSPSTVDETFYCANGFSLLTQYDAATGSIVTTLELNSHLGLLDDIKSIADLEHTETLLIGGGNPGRALHIVHRDGGSLSYHDTIDVSALITQGGFLGDTCYAYAPVLAYDFLNVPHAFSVTYFTARGGICRYIKTVGAANQPVGLAYLKADSGDGVYSLAYGADEGVTVMKQLGNYGASQVYVSDHGELVYVLIDDGTHQYIQCYKTFYGLFNNQSSARKQATMTAAELTALGGFDYFELVYSRIVSLATNVYWPGSNQRKLKQGRVAVGSNTEISVIDLISGRVVNHPSGDYVSLVAYGSFDYGAQNFPDNVIWDPDNQAFFYYGMSGGSFKDFAGRGYLDNPADNIRVNYKLEDAFRDISELAGYATGEIVVSGLSSTDDVITGMALNQSVGYTDLISQLAAGFRVNVIETAAFGIKFVKRSPGASVDFTITPDDCLQISDQDGHLVDINMLATNQLPTVLQLSYVDPDQQYLVATQQAKRQVYPNRTIAYDMTVNISIPIIMTADRAQYYVGFALFDMWSGKVTLTVNLPTKFVLVDPGDFCTLTLIDGREITCQVTGLQINADKSVTASLSASQINRFVPQNQITDHK